MTLSFPAAPLGTQHPDISMNPARPMCREVAAVTGVSDFLQDHSTMNHRLEQMLRQLQHGPRTPRSWTNGIYALPINVVVSHLECLVERGYATREGRGETALYEITESGESALATYREPVPSREFVNASMKVPYTAPKWQIRAGGDAHRQFASVGIGC